MRQKVIQALGLGLSVLLLYSCGTSARTMYTWYGYDDVAYEYSRNRSQENTANLIKVYEQIINKQKGTRGQIPPGMCAEYGYLLVKQGKQKEGIALLEREMKLYPESQVFVGRIVEQLKK